MLESDDIFEKEYSGLYCVGCESYKTTTELDENGNCLIHLTKTRNPKRNKLVF